MEPLEFAQILTTILSTGTAVVALRKLHSERRLTDSTVDIKKLEVEERRQALYEKAVNDLMERDTLLVDLRSRVQGLESDKRSRARREKKLRAQIRDLEARLLRAEEALTTERDNHALTKKERDTLTELVNTLNDQVQALQSRLDDFSLPKETANV